MARAMTLYLGVRNHQAKLNDEKVLEARKFYTESQQAIKDLRSEFGIQGLADRYKVSFPTMRKALQGITWSHLE